MTENITETGTITREVRIEAPPDLVFAYLTDPDRLVEWMGRRVTIEPHPGGVIEIDHNGFDIMRGEILEVTPYTRVVHTMGWLSLDANAAKPGTSTVEFTLEEDGGATLLRVVHSGLPALDLETHGEGWDWMLPRLVSVVVGKPVENLDVPLTTGEQLASELNSLLIEAVSTIENTPDERWTKPVPNDGRTAAVVADHLAGHLNLMNFATAIASGDDPPPVTPEEVEQANAARAAEAADISREAVVAAIQRDGPPAVETLRSFTGAQLAMAKPLPVAGGAVVSVHDLLTGPLLHDIDEHLRGIRAATQAP